MTREEIRTDDPNRPSAASGEFPTDKLVSTLGDEATGSDTAEMAVTGSFASIRSWCAVR
jgi:hypothetical protein